RQPREPSQPLGPSASDRPTVPQDPDDYANQHPGSEAGNIDPAIHRSTQEADEQRAQRSEHGDDAALPDVVERKTAVPREPSAETDGEQQPGRQGLGCRVSDGVRRTIVSEDGRNDLGGAHHGAAEADPRAERSDSDRERILGGFGGSAAQM